MWYLVLVLLGVAGVVWYALHRSTQDAGSSLPAPADINKVWPRSGAYACDVAGESHYQDALRLASKIAEKLTDTPLLALLTPEQNNQHDSNAVSVSIAGNLVGHLPRDVAPAYRRLLELQGGGLQPVYAYARITGGFDLGDGTPAHLGLRLDIKDLENY